MKWNVALLAASLCLPAAYARAEDTAQVEMKLLPKGGMQKIGGYRPQRVELSGEKPAELKKAPEASAPMYGKLKFGGQEHLVLVDEPAQGDAKLYVDTNANGDLTDDPATTWNVRSYPMGPGKTGNQHMGSCQIALPGDKGELVSLGVYRFDPNDPQRKALAKSLFYYADYVLDGTITLNGAPYHALLADSNATGDFAGQNATLQLLIDITGDGRFSRGEVFDASKPFNIKGTTWQISDRAADGSFKIAKSDQTVAEIPLPPDHAVGKPITPFTATTTDGKAVSFPGDYKGKVVMLDFWATWCGPCMGEVPGLVKTYNQLHPQGFEILGISLDQPNAADKVKTVTGEKGMTWPQVYDGKFWQAEIAQKYVIESIPAAFLVDGDTGQILASGNSLRGEALEATIKAALDKKKQK